MYQFAMATRTNCCEMDGLKQEQFLLSQAWKPEAPHQSAGRATFLLQALGEILPGSSNFWWLLAFPSSCQHNSGICSYLHTASVLCLGASNFSLLPVINPMTRDIDPKSQIFHLEILNLIISARILFPNQVPFTDTGC